MNTDRSVALLTRLARLESRLEQIETCVARLEAAQTKLRGDFKGRQLCLPEGWSGLPAGAGFSPHT